MNLASLDLQAASPNEARLVRNTALAILALVALRLAAAAWTPLTFDEAYYFTRCGRNTSPAAIKIIRPASPW